MQFRLPVLTTDEQSISKQIKAEERASWKRLIQISSDTSSPTDKGFSLFLEVNSRITGHSPLLCRTLRPNDCELI
jgi:hypothetical protein